MRFWQVVKTDNWCNPSVLWPSPYAQKPYSKRLRLAPLWNWLLTFGLACCGYEMDAEVRSMWKPILRFVMVWTDVTWIWISMSSLILIIKACQWYQSEIGFSWVGLGTGCESNPSTWTFISSAWDLTPSSSGVPMLCSRSGLADKIDQLKRIPSQVWTRLKPISYINFKLKTGQYW